MPRLLRRAAPLAWVPTNTGNQICGSTVLFRQDAGRPWSLQVGSNQERCFRFETRLGDFAPSETDRTRSELQFTRKYDARRDIWLAWRLRYWVLPRVVSNSLVIGQLHQTEDAGDASGYPPFEFEIGADRKLYIYTATVPEPSRPTFYPRTMRAGPIELSQGVFHDIVTRIRLDWAGEGLLYVWVDGTQVVGVDGVSIGMNDAVGPYLKLGTYSRPETAAQTAIAEYYRVSEGYEDLRDRI